MKKGTLLIPASIGLLAIGAWIGLQPISSDIYRADMVEALSTSDSFTQFERAITVRDFEFPADFGPHPGFQTEWWYYTGNLTTADSRRFGYQLTFFRRALDINPAQGRSKWRTNQLYFAHFAVTDVEQEQFHSFERFSRSALGLSGAQAQPYRVWLENWKVVRNNDEFVISAAEEAVELKLHLIPVKPIILQGDRGLSRKGKKVGNASYYFSQSRLKTQGTITIDSVESNVTGHSWLDKEWSTSALEKGDKGWDWFSIQLDDNRELMLFQIRSTQGNISRYSSGTYVDSSGIGSHLSREEFIIKPTTTWKSPHTGIVYPATWKVEIPSQKLNLTITPHLNDQEHRNSFIYWEGAVRITSDTVNGNGYVELTGYEKKR